MKPTSLLVILDGWGHGEASPFNAIHIASTPNWDRFLRQAPHTFLNCCGTDVGLPKGQMGNSEVGHMTIGAGRAILQDLYRIDEAIENRTFHQSDVLMRLLENTASHTLHALGLLSPGGVHSHARHFEALIRLAAEHDVKVAIHAFLDGRDTPPKSALSTLVSIDDLLQDLQVGRIASICGRYYAMDRDKRWDRTSRAYRMITSGEADFIENDLYSALSNAYARNEPDEFVKPTLILPIQPIVGGDSVIFMNFRADRARQLTHAFVDRNFEPFTRDCCPMLRRFVTLTSYGSHEEFGSNTRSIDVIFNNEKVKNSIGEYLQHEGMRQFRIAETEKYAHVTYFFSGGRETPFNNEMREFIPSPKVSTYDLKPEMSAREITTRVTQAIGQSEFDFVVCNFANGDMVGHTGNVKASQRAVEVIDECLGVLGKVIQSTQSQCLITADHGNVECLKDERTASNHTAHTLNQVPLVYLGPKKVNFRPGGTLADVSPTLLDLMDLRIPVEMTGNSLVERC